MTVSINRWSAHPYFFINGDLDYRVIKALKREMSFYIEGFERTKKYKEGRWDGQECLFYKSKADNYFFPCGMIDVAKRVFNDFEIDYIIQDIKLKDIEKKYKKLDLTWTGHDLRDYQMKAVMDIKNNDGGTICLPTGAGKTLIMLRLAYEYNLPFLVVVHTKELLYQWEKNIKTYFNGRCPGLVGDGYSNFDPITIGMMQTLSKKIVKDKMDNLDYPIIMIDECHRAPADTAYMVAMKCFPHDTVVKTSDGYITIGEIVNKKLDVSVLTHTGSFRKVVGWIKKPLSSMVCYIQHDCGTLQCTYDHKILTSCGFKRASDLQKGDVIYYDVDGSWTGKVDNNTDESEIGCRCLGEYKNQELREGISSPELNTTDRKTEAYHTRRFDGGYVHNDAETSTESIVANRSRYKPTRVRYVEVCESFKPNVFTPVGSEEGWVRKGVCECSVQNAESSMSTTNIQYDRCEREKDNNRVVVGGDGASCITSGMVYGRREHNNTVAEIGKPNDERYPVLARSNDTIGNGDDIGVDENAMGYSEQNTQDKRCENGILRGSEIQHDANHRKRECEGFCGYNTPICDTNDGIQGECFVYDITVEVDHTYTANGVVVSNCNAPVRIGASATPVRTDGADIKIWAACGEIKTTITADELIKRGILAKPEFRFLTPPPVYTGRRSHYSDVYLQGIVVNEGRNEMIIKYAKKYAEDGNIVYVHVERIDHGEMLKERIPGAVFLSGKDGTTVRQGILRKYSKGEIKVLISTLLKEGVDIPTMNVFIAAGAGKSPIGVLQKAGRALRTAPGKDSAVIVDFRDSGKYLGDHWSERYNIYKTTFGDYCP